MPPPPYVVFANCVSANVQRLFAGEAFLIAPSVISYAPDVDILSEKRLWSGESAEKFLKL